MTTRYRKFEFQLQDRNLGSDLAGPSIIGTGSKCIVTGAGSPAKATLYDADGAALTNPITLTAGKGVFYTLDTVESVDLFILTGGGYSVQLWDVTADGLHQVPVDRGNRNQVLVLPISVDDQLADNTEVDTGLDLIVGMVMLPWPHIKVVTEDAGETLSVGTGEAVPADGGDADGFISAASVATAGLVKDVDGALITAIVTFIAVADSLTWTLSAASDTAEAYAFLPYILMTTGSPSI